MGLLIKLQNGDTALKSLKFGKDRPGGGSSNQPYIQNPIIEAPGVLSQFDNDFLLRGGLRAPINAAEDVARLTKYMFDFKSPSGLLFIAKQNLLSLVAPRTETSGILNEGVYTPLSTLLQAGVGFIGIHVRKQGIDPTGLLPNVFGLSPRTYSEEIEKQIKKDLKSGDFEVSFNIKNKQKDLKTKNRLLELFQKKQIILYSESLKENNLRVYAAGPGAPLGIGVTRIQFATDNKGLPSRTIQPTDYSWSINDFFTESRLPSTGLNSKIREDFRNKLPFRIRSIIGATKDYSTTNNIEKNFNLGNPGQSGNVSNYTRGKILVEGVPSVPTDKVTAYPIYQSKDDELPTDSSLLNDLIPFNIAILNNGGGNVKKFIHFRAFIDSFSDSYSADWGKIEYMGRAEKFYKYKGFDRDISLAFTVAAQSKDELSVMYDKLNFLASSLAPEYLPGQDGLTEYMAGNIAYLTVGDYIVNQPGVITSLTFDVPEESPWEISIKNDGTAYTLDEKANQDFPRRLPHMIKVTGFKFIPIHTFRPEIIKNLEGNVNKKYIDPIKTRITTTVPGQDPVISNEPPTSTELDLEKFLENFKAIGFAV